MAPTTKKVKLFLLGEKDQPPLPCSSIDLPARMKIVCPNCGNEISDNGKTYLCLSMKGVLVLAIDCRECGSYYRAPSIKE